MMLEMMQDYQFIKNPKGELVLVFTSQDSILPNKPIVYYDGHDRAFFKKNSDFAYILPAVPEAIAHHLAFVHVMAVVEQNNTNHANYQAQCIFSQHIPALHNYNDESL